MKKYMKRLFGLLMALCMMSSLFVPSARAAEAASKYDFSAQDSLDKYSQYKKVESTGEILLEGVPYVEAGTLNRINMSDPYPLDFARYGAYLRNAEEEQHYKFLNLHLAGNDVISQNVLTIYADPEVNFEVKNATGRLVVDNNGVKLPENVAYFNKTEDHGHNVYYIELNPSVVGQSAHSVTFSTKSTTTQPHYSFWFGCPLVETKTVTGNTLFIRATKPNSTSSVVSVKTPASVPSQRAWIHILTINQLALTGASNASARLTVTMPEKTTSSVGKFISSSDKSVSFDGNANTSYAAPASGTYKFQLEGIKWKTTAATASYSLEGRMQITYIYAFGA